MDLQIIQNKIFEVRGCRVMLDYHFLFHLISFK